MNLTPEALAAEQRAIEKALKATKGNVTEAAKDLDVPRRTLWRRLAYFKIEPDTYRPEPKP